MSTLFNGVANSNTTNVVPVQGIFDQNNNLVNLVGPGGKTVPAAILSTDSNNNVTGIVNPNGIIQIIDASSYGVKSGAWSLSLALANVTAIQKALNYLTSIGGGKLQFTQSGNYPVVGNQTVSGTNALSDYGMVSVSDNIEIYIGQGVTLQHNPTSANLYGRSIFTNSAINSNRVSVTSNGWITGTYSQTTTVLTVTLSTTTINGHLLAVGDIVALASTTITTGATITGHYVITATNGSTTITVANTTQSATGNVSLVSYSPYFAPNNTQNLLTPFYTSTAHNLVAGGYVLIKGDTSIFNWNRVHRVASVLSPTAFIIENHYTESPLPIAGTVICYQANNNIKITIDGLLDGQMNVLFNTVGGSSWTTSFRSIASVATFNKFGNITVSGNLLNMPVGVVASNFDNFVVNNLNADGGYNPFQMCGPFRNLTFNNCSVSHNEEFVFAGTNDPSGTGPNFLDGDGTNNSGGDIDNITVDGLISKYMAIQTLSFAPDGGNTIKNISIKKARQTACTTSAFLFLTQATDAYISTNTGSFGRISLDDIQMGQNNQSPLINIIANRLTISEFAMNNFNINDPISGAPSNALGIAMSLGSVTVSASIDKIRLSNGYVSAITSNTNLPVVFVLSNSSWVFNELIVDSIRFVESGVATSNYMVGISSIAVNNQIVNTTLLATNVNSCILAARATGATSRLINCRTYSAGAKGSNIIQAYTSQTIKLINCDSGVNTSGYGGSMVLTGSTIGAPNTLTLNLYYSGCNVGGVGGSKGSLFYGYSASQGYTFNLSSGNGNTNCYSNNSNMTGNTFIINGNCSDLQSDVTKLSRTVAGGIIQHDGGTTITSAVAGDLFMNDATNTTNSWHALKSPILVTY